MGVAKGPQIVTDGLIFLIDAGNHASFTPGASNILDIGGTKARGAFTSVTTTNNNLNFDDTSASKILFSADSALEDFFDGGGSVEFWIRPESDGQFNFGRVFSTSQPGGGFIFYVHNEAGSFVDLCFIQQFSGDDGTWSLEDLVGLNVWSHITVTYNADSASNVPSFYFNGALQSITTLGTPTLTRNSNTGNNLNIGNRNDSSRTFDGDINYLAIYNKELTASQVAQNYKRLKKRFGHV